MSSKVLSLGHPLHPHPAGYGGDGWMTVSLILMRTATVADLPEGHALTEEQAAQGPFVTPLQSWLDLCPECAQRTMVGTGCLDKIVQQVPRPPNRCPVGQVQASSQEVEPRERGKDKTSWARLGEDDDDAG